MNMNALKNKILGSHKMPVQKVLQKELDDLEKEFSENLARIYNKGAHASGV
jgi:hypothetical protein